MKHCETHIKHRERLTQTLTIQCNDIGARCSDISAYADGVGITLQMCIRVTIHGDMSIFFQIW